MKKFEFKKSYEEIEINGDVYKIELGDEKIKEYQKLFTDFYEESQALYSNSEAAKTPDKQNAFIEQSKVLVQHTIDILIGAGSYEKLYEQSGKSLLNMIELVTFLTDVIKEKAAEIRRNAVEKYVSPGE